MTYFINGFYGVIANVTITKPEKSSAVKYKSLYFKTELVHFVIATIIELGWYNQHDYFYNDWVANGNIALSARLKMHSLNTDLEAIVSFLPFRK